MPILPWWEAEFGQYPAIAAPAAEGSPAAAPPATAPSLGPSRSSGWALVAAFALGAAVAVALPRGLDKLRANSERGPTGLPRAEAQGRAGGTFPKAAGRGTHGHAPGHPAGHSAGHASGYAPVAAPRADTPLVLELPQRHAAPSQASAREYYQRGYQAVV